MSYTIEPSSDGKYVIVTQTGDITAETAAESKHASNELGRTLGINCYLIDVTEARNTERVLGNVHLAQEDAPLAIESGVRYAVLVKPGDHSHDFVVAFARTQGIDTTLFDDRSEAVEHLESAAGRLNTTPPDRGESGGVSTRRPVA
jgi:hypothetical protein